MIRGLYISNTGLNASQRALDKVAGNLANANTTGYKQQTVAHSTFKEALLTRNRKSVIGETTHGVKLDEIRNDFTQGSIQKTDRALDFAINGDAFFTVQLPNGGYQYTKDGSFHMDRDGFLVNDNGYYVQGEAGPLTVDDNNELNQGFALTSFTNKDLLRKEGENLYSNNNNANANRADQIPVMKGYLETSNVDIAKNMSDMLLHSKYMSFNSRVLNVQDKILEKSVSEVGSVRG